MCKSDQETRTTHVLTTLSQVQRCVVHTLQRCPSLRGTRSTQQHVIHAACFPRRSVTRHGQRSGDFRLSGGVESRLEKDGEGTGASHEGERKGDVNEVAGVKTVVVGVNDEEPVEIDMTDDDAENGDEDDDDGDVGIVVVEEEMVADEVNGVNMASALSSSTSESPSFGTRLMVAPPRRLRLSMRASLLLSCSAAGGSSVLSMIEIHHLACIKEANSATLRKKR